jgi:branched-chain amino acid transport system substrate-binding protein
VTASPEPVISIGVDVPLSGPDGGPGNTVLNGIRFAIDEQPRISGYRLTLEQFDDSLNGNQSPARGVSNVRSMLADPNVVGMIGPYGATVAAAEIPVAGAGQMAMVNPVNSNACLTKDVPICAGMAAQIRGSRPNNYFRMSSTDELQGPAMADFAGQDLAAMRVAVASDSDAYGKMLADTFTAELVRNGGAAVVRQDFSVQAPIDFHDFLSRAKDKSAQAVFFGGLVKNRGCLIRAQMEDVFTAAIPELGGQGLALSDQCIRDAAPYSTGLYATASSVDADALPSAATALSKFRAAYPAASAYGVYTIPAYEATRILISAIGRAIAAAGGNRPTRESVRAILAQTNAFPTSLGPVSFDANGDSTLRWVSVYAVLGAPAHWQFVTQTNYTPAT